MNILKLVSSSSFLAFNKEIAKRTDILCALIFADLAGAQDYWNTQAKKQEVWFYRTRETIKQETTISEKRQLKAINILKSHGLVKTQLASVPAKVHYLIDKECMMNLLDLLSQNGVTGQDETAQQDKPKRSNINKNKEFTINNKNKSSLKQKQVLQSETISDNSNPIVKTQEAQKEKVAPKRKFKMTRHGNDYPSADESLEQTMNKVGEDLFEPKGKHELWLTDFFQQNNTEYLQVFKTQPTNDQLAKVISAIGQDGLIRVLNKIEVYCKGKPSYCKKRKTLIGVIRAFLKDFDRSSVTALKSIFNIEYQKRFKEQYKGKRTYTRHIEAILSNIESALDLKYSDLTKPKIEAEFKKVLSKLPEKYNSPTQFKIEFISSNFQELRLHCKSGVVEKGSKQGDVSQAYKGVVKW